MIQFTRDLEVRILTCGYWMAVTGVTLYLASLGTIQGQKEPLITWIAGSVFFLISVYLVNGTVRYMVQGEAS